MTANHTITPVAVDTTGPTGTLTGVRVTPPTPRATAVLLPGAGGTFAGDGLTFLAGLFATSGFDTVVVNLTHNERGHPPARIARAVDEFADIISQVTQAPGSLVVGGKSFGSRVALTYAATHPVIGVFAYGFPLHAPGKQVWRHDMFGHLAMPGLFVSGSRDPFATPDELRVALESFAGKATHLVVDGGDHDCAVAKKHAPDGVRKTPAQGLTEQQDAICAWLIGRCRQP